MADVKIPYADPGRASFEVLDTHLQGFLLVGSSPALAPAIGVAIPYSANYAQFTVLGIKNGELVPAKRGSAQPTDDVQAQFVLAHAVQRGANPAPVVNGQVFYQGNFNIDALIWDASFTTDAQKTAAFFGATNPTHIVVAKRAA